MPSRSEGRRTFVGLTVHGRTEGRLESHSQSSPAEGITVTKAEMKPRGELTTCSPLHASQKHEPASTGPQAIAPWCGRAPRVVRGKPSGFATVYSRGGELEGTKGPKGQRDAALALTKRTLAVLYVLRKMRWLFVGEA